MRETDSDTPIIYHADMGLQNALGYVTYVYSDRTEIELEVSEIHLNRAGFPAWRNHLHFAGQRLWLCGK